MEIRTDLILGIMQKPVLAFKKMLGLGSGLHSMSPLQGICHRYISLSLHNVLFGVRTCTKPVTIHCQ